MVGTTGQRFTSDKHAPLGLNLGSVPQKQHLLFSLLRLGAFVPRDNKEFLTDTGGLSTSAAVVDFLLGHAVVPAEAKAVLRLVKLYGKLTDTRSDFVNSIREKVRPDGTVHAEFTQWVTRTGRLSCKRPNLQQIQKSLRPFFMAPEGYTFVDADYSEIEVRCWAELSRDPLLMKALSEEPDFHRFTVGMALGKAPEQVTDEERQRGKVLTFGGTMYRGGAPVIAKSMGIPMDRAQDLFENIQALYSRGAAWMDHQITCCRRQGYVQSPLGRLRRLPGINSVEKGTRVEAERQSVNSVIQGLASDITGLAALRVEALWEQEGIDGWIAILVHDSIVTIVRDDQVEKAAALLVEEMCRPPYTQWVVPLRAKTSISKRWNGELDIEAVLTKLGAASEEEDDNA
jgi:DNA polymerase-1